MRYLSLFSGIGGFELGIARARPGWECAGYSETDRHADAVYKRHFPNHTNHGDARAIDPDRLPEFGLLCGGFPCQSFSIAGRRLGFADTRGTLFFEVERILRRRRCRYVLLENVRGLLSHDAGRTFRTILAALDGLGYDLQWQVLDSAYFCVPQHRERVYILGHLRGEPRPEVFPLTGVRTQDRGLGAGRAAHLSGSDRFGHQVSGRHFYTLCASALTGIIPNWDPGNPGGMAVRRLTPTECERLQGFPDGWTEGIGEAQRYKVLGNAVTVTVVRAVVERLGIA